MCQLSSHPDLLSVAEKEEEETLNPYVDITILLDRSGSMQAIKSAMEEGFNAFLLEHKKTPSTRVTLVEFDTPTGAYMEAPAVETRYTALPINSVPKLELVPRGGTPLLDALCKTIDATGTRLKAKKANERPTGVLFVIITDGEENSSHSFTRADCLKRITHQTDSYQWQFVYLGANQDALQEAATLGIPQTQTITYTPTTASSTWILSNMGAKTAAYTANVARGMSSMAASHDSLTYTDDERYTAANTTEEDLKKKKTPLTPPAGVGG